MAKKQSPPLTEDEIRSVYRNEFYPMDTARYYNHKCTGGSAYGRNKQIEKDLRKKNRKK